MSKLWWETAGFSWDPFGEVNAAREKRRLDSYAVEPPSFAEVLAPQHHLVSGPSGGGKTTLSWLLAQRAAQSMVLVIPCTDVGQVIDRAGGDPGRVTDVELVEQIQRRFLRDVPGKKIEAALAQPEEAASRKMPPTGLDYPRGLRETEARLGRAHPQYQDFLIYEQRLRDNLEWVRLYGSNEGRRSERSEIVGNLNRLCLAELGISFNRLCSPVEGGDSLDDYRGLRRALEPGATERLTGTRSTAGWLEWLVEVARRLGHEQVYVVYDTLDGHTKTKDPQACAAIVRPLLEATALLDVDGLYFKFFLPPEVRDYLRGTPGIVTGRVAEIELRWSEGQLREVLRLRLLAASDNTYESLGAFSEVKDVDDRIIQNSNTPRDVLLLGRRLFQTRHRYSTGPLLRREDIEDIEPVLDKRPRASKEGDHGRNSSQPEGEPDRAGDRSTNPDQPDPGRAAGL